VIAESSEEEAAEIERRFVLIEHEVPLGGTTVRLRGPRSAEELIDEQDFVRDERMPYWAELWPSARVMAARLAMENGSDERLLELGCGLGLLTIAALSAGYSVLATDYYADALLFTRVNTYDVLGRVPRTRLMDWRDVPDDLGRFPRVVAADVLYEREYASLVAEVLARTLAPDGRATVADPGRSAAPEFVRRCAELHLRVDVPPSVPYEDGAIRQRIQLYEIRWLPGLR
jgi:predicted nicotinamide N-methyase